MLDTFDNIALLSKDRKLLQKTRVPMVTVAASWRDDLAKFHGVDTYFGDNQDEVLFSRAHYSMMLGVLMQAWGDRQQPKKAWGVDPTNYVHHSDWNKIVFTQNVGKLMARYKLLKIIKDLIDTKVRSKLPITNAITTPLLHLFEHVRTPILSFHYEATNILAAAGHSVVSVVTDPHVRIQYIEFAHVPAVRFCVFDEKTKTDFLELCEVAGKKVDPHRIIVTGPPVDPRIVDFGTQKHPYTRTRPLRLALTTGGLGTNTQEIFSALRSLAPYVRGTNDLKIQLIVYVGVHEDIREKVHQIANQEGIATCEAHDVSAPLRILYSPHIVTANELLIQHVFSWADGFVTKPSGDMAYDAAASGAFLLTLDPWGEWEHNIRDIFEQKGVSRRAIPQEIGKQLESLLETNWIADAMKATHALPPIFTTGSKNILAQMPKT